jgi:uncharacterized protein YcaQ
MRAQISLETARRFLALRHLLAPARSLPADPASILAVVDRLGSLQFDPLDVAGRNHDLVLLARIGGYRRELTEELLYGRRLLFEAYNKALCLLPTRELPYYRITWQEGADGRAGRMVSEQAVLADKILAEISSGGPRCSTDFEREAAIDWWWGPTSAVRAVLEALEVSGRLGLARRDGNRKYYDLTERLFPADLLATRIPEREQRRHKVLSRYRGHGLLGAGGSGELWPGTGGAAIRSELRRDLLDRGELAGVTVEGMRGERFIVGDELPLLVQAEREVAAGTPPGDAAATCTFLAPLDPLLWDRGALEPLYQFDYRWEVYTPAAKRKWGYYVLPILFGDRLVGRIEPRLDRKARVVRVLGLSWEPGFDPLQAPGFAPAFAAALDNYAGFGGADSVVTPPGAAHLLLFRSLAGEVRVSRGESGAPKPVRASPTGRRTASTLRGGVIDATIALSQH